MVNRCCILSGQPIERDNALRFVVSPNGEVVCDIREKLPGEGCWVEADYAKILEAVETGAFEKALPLSQACKTDLADDILRQLREYSCAQLGMARRSGNILTGFDSVYAALKQGQVALLLVAADAAQASRKKIDALARATEVETSSVLSRGQLSAAFGRQDVVNAAILGGGAGSGACLAVRRFGRYVLTMTKDDIKQI